MKVIDAREAKQGFGRMLDEARRAPVAIHKHGRRVAVIMASEDYEWFEKIYHIYKTRKTLQASRKKSVKKSAVKKRPASRLRKRKTQ